MVNTKLKVMLTLTKVIRKHGKNYCTASQKTICDLLGKYQDADIKTRTLRYHLKDLKDNGLIKSIRRTHRKSDGTLILQTSATCLTAWGYEMMYKLTGNKWFKTMADNLKTKYWPKLVKIFRQKKEEPGEDLRERRERSRKKIKELYAALN